MRRNIPILDAAYMERRARNQALKYQFEILRALNGERELPKDVVAKAQDAYVTGEITLDVFEARLNIAFGIAP